MIFKGLKLQKDLHVTKENNNTFMHVNEIGTHIFDTIMLTKDQSNMLRDAMTEMWVKDTKEITINLNNNGIMSDRLRLTKTYDKLNKIDVIYFTIMMHYSNNNDRGWTLKECTLDRQTCKYLYAYLKDLRIKNKKLN